MPKNTANDLIPANTEYEMLKSGSSWTSATCLLLTLFIAGVSTAEEKSETKDTGEASYNVADCGPAEDSDGEGSAAEPDTGAEQIDLDKECREIVK